LFVLDETMSITSITWFCCFLDQLSPRNIKVRDISLILLQLLIIMRARWRIGDIFMTRISYFISWHIFGDIKLQCCLVFTMDVRVV
jgi:hypothetical protein